VLGDRATIGRGQRLLIVDDVEQRFVDLPNVVEECHSLDALALVLGEVGRLAEDQRVGGHATGVSARFGIVRVDGIEQRLQCGGGKAFGGTAGLLAADQHGSSGGSSGAGAG